MTQLQKVLGNQKVRPIKIERTSKQNVQILFVASFRFSDELYGLQFS